MLLFILMTKENKEGTSTYLIKTAQKAGGGGDGAFRVQLFRTSLYALFIVGSLK